MPFCNKCGLKVTEDSLFCYMCGNKLPTERLQSASTPPIEEETTPVVPSAPPVEETPPVEEETTPAVPSTPPVEEETTPVVEAPPFLYIPNYSGERVTKSTPVVEPPPAEETPPVAKPSPVVASPNTFQSGSTPPIMSSLLPEQPEQKTSKKPIIPIILVLIIIIGLLLYFFRPFAENPKENAQEAVIAEVKDTVIEPEPEPEPELKPKQEAKRESEPKQAKETPDYQEPEPEPATEAGSDEDVKKELETIVVSFIKKIEQSKSITQISVLNSNEKAIKAKRLKAEGKTNFFEYAIPDPTIKSAKNVFCVDEFSAGCPDHSLMIIFKRKLGKCNENAELNISLFCEEACSYKVLIPECKNDLPSIVTRLNHLRYEQSD